MSQDQERVVEVLAEIEKRASGSTYPSRHASAGQILTGVTRFDALTMGFEKGDVVAIAGSPGSGKTALALQAAIVSAVLGDATALVCSLESTTAQIVERVLVHLARLNSWKVRAGAIDPGDLRSLHEAGRTLHDSRLHIEDRTFGLADILNRAREWRAAESGGIGVLVVDAIQLTRVAACRADDEYRATQLALGCASLKELAKELGVAVILVSHITRSPGRDSRPPMMRDLRESGAIEAVADTVVLIHNPEGIEDGPVELLLDKNRKGPRRSVSAHWVGRHYAFHDIGYEDTSGQQQLGVA